MCASPRIIIMVIVIIIVFIIVIVVIIIGRGSWGQLLFKASPFTENAEQIFKHFYFLTYEFEQHTQVNNNKY